MAELAAAPLVFAGPGSPTYALRQWQGTLVPSLLAEKLALGGALTFASAAALTLGAVTVPVYEVYKVGEDPHWVPGLDLLAGIGLPVALIPHYDNAEGGTHDTRFCYLGEERLAGLEHDLPEGTFVLGVDEHTALGIDLDAGRVEVAGHGGVTVRVKGRSVRIESGEAMALGRLVEMAADLATDGAATHLDRRAPPLTRSRVPVPARRRARTAAGPRCSGPSGDSRSPSGPPGRRPMRAPWWRRSSPSTTSCGRGARTPCSPTPSTGAAPACGPWWPSLGELATEGAPRPRRDRRPVCRALPSRCGTRARRERRFEDADAVRDRLVALGVEVNDSAEGSTWRLGPTTTPPGERRQETLIACQSPDRSSPHRLVAEDAALSRR